MFKKPSVLYAVIAAAALFVGLLVYLFGRQPEHVYFLFHGFSFAYGYYSPFGVLGNYLPSFVHVYAFILLTAAVAGSSNARLLRICTVWFVIASLFECGQHPAVSPVIAAALPAWFARVPVLDHTAAYFLNGTFDLLDLLSIATGTVAAYLTVVLIRNRAGTRPSDNPMRSVFRCFAMSGLMLTGMLTIIGSGGDGTAMPGPAAGGSQLYVSGNGDNTLLSYNDANTVSGSMTANRTVTGASTMLAALRGIAVDMARNQIYVANFAANSILVFNNARTVTGNVAPIRTITGVTLDGPTALFMDGVNNRLYVANTGGNSVLVYNSASTLNGDTTPGRTLSAGATTISAPTGIYVDTTRNVLYVSNGNSRILVFNNADSVSGGTAPDRTIAGLSNPNGIFVDVMSDRVYIANTGANSVLVFNNASTVNGSPAANRVISIPLNLPRDVFVDAGTDRLYVANAGDNSILVFNNASTVNNPAAPDRTLGLSSTTSPWGVYVDVTPIVIGSTASLDGYARSDTTASATGSPAIGDKDMSYSFGIGWRQLYSFDIASIPGSYTITSAMLHLYQCNVVGFPYVSLGNVIVDHVSYGSVFGAGIYDSATVAANIGTISTTTSLGYRSLDVMASVQNDLTALPLRTRSQYRLRFSLQDTNFDGNDDFVQFTDTEDSLCAGAATNQPPQLAISIKP